MAGVLDAFRGLALAIGWLVIAAAMSLGAAGIVAGIDHRPGPARPELTWASDRQVRPVLDEVSTELVPIADDLETLGLTGRRALSAMVAGDDVLLDQLLADGGLLAGAIEEKAAALRFRLTALPGTGAGAELRLGREVLDRHAASLRALDSLTSLEESWAVLLSGSLTATRMTAYLEGHDAAAFAATEAGRAQDYATALTRLDEAEAHLADAATLRDRLAGQIETATLDEWLRRNREYDAALRRLYTAFRDSNGRVTQEVRDAIAAELAAREQLPEDTSGLVIIVAEIGRGGANQAVIEIERARATFDGALAALSPVPDGAEG